MHRDAADRMARDLFKMAVDESVSDSVKLAAIRGALDRAGLSARTAISMEVGKQPFEVIFDDITSGSRTVVRASRAYLTTGFPTILRSANSYSLLGPCLIMWDEVLG
jgi:hypothetical protein